VLVFERGRVRFAADIVRNLTAPAASRFSLCFGQPLVETEVAARSALAKAAGVNKETPA
jgi:hypothetical protein